MYKTFNMTAIGKTIRQARIRENMTQLELADQMGVSFQAVSNWERGNSMPDISKLEPLCQVLHLNVQELLSGQPQATAAVVKVLKLKDDPLTEEELADVAPLLPPAQMEEETRKTSAGKKWDMQKLSHIVPFLDQDTLAEICENAQVVSLKDLAGIAPFLGEETLDKMVRGSGANDWEGIIALAPFLGNDTLDTLAARCLSNADIHGLKELAPFLSDETLGKIAMNVEMDNQSLLELAPFLSDEALSQIALKADMDSSTLSKLAPFLDENTLDQIVDKLLEKGDTKGLTDLYPFLGRDTMRKILRYIINSGDDEGIEEAAFFL